jgi:site-specific DNA-methyltransferase (adenine-specific)
MVVNLQLGDTEMLRSTVLTAPSHERASSSNARQQPCTLLVRDCFTLLASIPDATVDCIWTDPPYLLSNGGITCRNGKLASVNKGPWDHSHGLAADHAFHLRWAREAMRVLRPAGTIWITGTLHVYLSIGMALLEAGFRILNDIIWQKPWPPPNLGRRCFTHSTETILWATKACRGSRDRYTFHYDAMLRENGGRQMQTVWCIPPPGPSEKRLGKHPTQKPVALVKRCLTASTNRGDLVVDTFTGSGTTAVAALSLDRIFLGCDTNADYIRLATARVAAVKTPQQLGLNWAGSSSLP